MNYVSPFAMTRANMRLAELINGWTKEDIRNAIEDYFADISTTKADMEELVELITGLVENHDWSVER